MKFVTKRQPLFLNQNLQRYSSTCTDINIMLQPRTKLFSGILPSRVNRNRKSKPFPAPNLPEIRSQFCNMDQATAALNWPPSKQRINFVSAKRRSMWTGFLEEGQGEERARQRVLTGTTIGDPAQKLLKV